MPGIAILLAPGFADWEYGFISGTGGPFYGLEVRFFGTQRGELASQGGLRVTVGDGPDDLRRWNPDVAAVIGGTAWAGEAAPDPGDTLRALADRGATVAGICGGTLALARAGLLDDVAHTSNELAFLEENAVNYRGAGRYLDSCAAVVDGGIITAPGTAPASFAAAVLEAAGLDPEAARTFRRMMAAEHGPGG